MNKYLKYSLWGAGAVVAVAAAAVAYIAITFDPNDYKAQVIRAVKDSKQRNLRLDGDIKLAFYPDIGANLSKVALSEFRSDKPFAAIESVRVSLALMPLLRKQVVVKELSVKGLTATLVKRKDGSTNIDDLLAKGEPKSAPQAKGASQPVGFDIASVSVSKANLAYLDEATGAKYAIKDLDLQTGALAPGVPGALKLSLGVQASQPRLDMTAQLKSKLTFDPAARKYRMQDIDLAAAGSALDFSDLKIKASGEFDADMASQAFSANKVALNASGAKAGDKFEAELQAPALKLAQDKYSVDRIALNATMKAASGDLVVHLVVPSGQGDAQALQLGAVTLDMDLKQPDQAFKVKASSPVSGNITARQFNLSNLTLAVQATGDKLPNKSVSSEMKGSVQLDALKESVQVALAGGLLQSKVKLKAGVNGFKEPAIRFDAEVDQFDVDAYRAKPSGAAKSSASPSPSGAAAPEQPFDLSGLRKLKLDGSLRVGALKLANLKLAQLNLDARARDGVLNLDPISVNLYEGNAKLRVAVNAAPQKPGFTLGGRVTGAQVAPLLKDLADLEIVEGKGNITLDLGTHGDRVSALKKGLNGSMAFDLANGAIRGIDLPRLVQGVQSIGKGFPTEGLGLNKNDKTAFSEFKASFKVANGVAHNDDLTIRAPLMRVAGQGDIDIGQDRLDYTTKVTASKSEGGSSLTVPVHLSGSFAALKYRVDYKAVVQDVVKQKAEAKVEAKKEELKSKARDKLKKLFK